MRPTSKLSRRRKVRELRRLLSLLLLMPLLAVNACARFGFSNRVLHDVPSPDGGYRAICQEVPVLDGPEYSTRLHRADGTFVRNLVYGSDAYPCHEIVWSPDGKLLLVLARHNSLIFVVDIDDPRRNRQVTLTDRGDVASNLRFVGPRRIAYLSCAASVARVWNAPEPFTCATGATDRRLGL